MLAEAAGSGAWNELTDEQRQDFLSAASIIRGQMSARQGFDVEKGGRVGVVGSCGTRRDGGSGSSGNWLKG